MNKDGDRVKKYIYKILTSCPVFGGDFKCLYKLSPIWTNTGIQVLMMMMMMMMITAWVGYP